MNADMHLIATTDETGSHADREQLQQAGKAGRHARVELRPYTEEDWVDDGERTFQRRKGTFRQALVKRSAHPASLA